MLQIALSGPVLITRTGGSSGRPSVQQITIKVCCACLPGKDKQPVPAASARLRASANRANNPLQLTGSNKFNPRASINDLPKVLRPYWYYRDEIGISDGVIFKGKQVIIPDAMRSDILHQLNEAHLGIEKTTLLMRESVYWTNI